MKNMYMQKSLFIISIILLLGFSCCKPKKQVVKPNLLIIQTDEHNFRTLGCYRETLTHDQAFLWGDSVAVETPEIDALAEDGVLCTSFYASTPVCSPSRSSFISGLYPQNTGVITNDIPLLDEIISFAHVLTEQGYATGYAGKWHLDGDGKPQWDPDRNFGFIDNRYMYNRGHWKMIEDPDNGPRVASLNAKGNADYGLKGVNEENFTTDYLTKKTIDFIKAHKDEPFCYMLSYPDPHGPNTVRAPYNSMYEHFVFEKPYTHGAEVDDLPSWGKKAKNTIRPKAIANYWGMVKCIDDNVGKIVSYLEESDLLDNTIVVFTSDHGDLLGEHHKDNKGNPYEGSAKIPFIIRYPSKLPAGLVINQALSVVDFTPTILSLMDAPGTGYEEGRDASLLFSGDMNIDWTDIAFMRGTGSKDGTDDKWLSAVSDRYKIVFSPEPEDLPWLFDLQEDPDELVNFFKHPDYQEIRKEMSAHLIEYGKKMNDGRIYHPKISKELAGN